MTVKDLPAEPASEAMSRAAEAFFKRLYLEHDFPGAMQAHAGPGFTEHNPDIPNSPDEQIRWFAERSAADPDHFAPETEWTTRLVHRIVLRDYLVVHYFLSVGATDRGRMFCDFWRFEGDKIVEHWDVVQPVPETTLSGNPMW